MAMPSTEPRVKDQASSQPPPNISHSEPEENAREFVVEKKMGQKVMDGEDYDLFRWKVYPNNDSAWQPESSMFNCVKLLEEYSDEMAERVNGSQTEPKHEFAEIPGSDKGMPTHEVFGATSKSGAISCLTKGKEGARAFLHYGKVSQSEKEQRYQESGAK